VRPDDCRNRPGAEPQPALRAGLLPAGTGRSSSTTATWESVDRAELEDVTAVHEHIAKRIGYRAHIDAFFFCLGNRTPEEPGVWRLPDLATAVSFTLETTTNDCN
jgi:hypothetical protein